MKYPFDNFLKACLLDKVLSPDIEAKADQLVLHRGTDWNTHLSLLTEEMCEVSPSMNRYLKEDGRRPAASTLQRALFDLRWVTDPDCSVISEVSRVLDHSIIRDSVESLLLLNEPPSLIVDRINSAHGFGITVPGLSCYRFYFWDTDSMTRADFGLWLDVVDEMLCPMQRQALTYDPHVVITRLGYGESKSAKKMLNDAFFQAYSSFNRIMSRPGGEYSEEAINWFRFLGPTLQAAAKMDDEGEIKEIVSEIRMELDLVETSKNFKGAEELFAENEAQSE